MERLVIELRVDACMIHYNVLEQTESIGVPMGNHQIPFRVGNRRYDLGNCDFPEIFPLSSRYINLWLGGRRGSDGSRPSHHELDIHADAIEHQRDVLAILLRFTRDRKIQFEQRSKS